MYERGCLKVGGLLNSLFAFSIKNVKISRYFFAKMFAFEKKVWYNGYDIMLLVAYKDKKGIKEMVS